VIQSSLRASKKLVRISARLLADRNVDHDPSHDIVEFEVPLGTLGVWIMASNTGLVYGSVKEKEADEDHAV